MSVLARAQNVFCREFSSRGRIIWDINFRWALSKDNSLYLCKKNVQSALTKINVSRILRISMPIVFMEHSQASWWHHSVQIAPHPRIRRWLDSAERSVYNVWTLFMHWLISPPRPSFQGPPHLSSAVKLLSDWAEKRKQLCLFMFFPSSRSVPL